MTANDAIPLLYAVAGAVALVSLFIGYIVTGGKQ